MSMSKFSELSKHMQSSDYELKIVNDEKRGLFLATYSHSGQMGEGLAQHVSPTIHMVQMHNSHNMTLNQRLEALDKIRKLTPNYDKAAPEDYLDAWMHENPTNCLKAKWDRNNESFVFKAIRTRSGMDLAKTIDGVGSNLGIAYQNLDANLAVYLNQEK